MKFSYVTNKEVSAVLCSVIKHAGSGRARKKFKGKETMDVTIMSLIEEFAGLGIWLCRYLFCGNLTKLVIL